MLKNKKAVYILIPLNLLIWGFFVYRFYSAYTDSDTSMPETQMERTKLDVAKDSVTYSLTLDYKDPFLKDVKKEYPSGQTSTNGIAQQEQKKNPVIKPIPNVPPKQLPEVKYLGLVKNTSSGMSAALVSVNGQSKLIKPNENVDGVVFKSFNKDSLVAKWGKERIVARK